MDPSKFKALQRKWYKKLEKDGFVDQEGENEYGPLSKGNFTARIPKKYNPEACKQKEEYYRKAGHFLWEHKFASKQERIIWALHAEGKSIDFICEELTRVGLDKARTQVGLVLQRLTKEMMAHVSKE